MSPEMRKNLESGFSLARNGVDFLIGSCTMSIGALIAVLVSGKGFTLVSKFVFGLACFKLILGFVLFVTGRVKVGLRSRKLNFETERPLTEEERWFRDSMLAVEGAAGKANLAHQVSKVSSGGIDDAVTATGGAAVVGSFFAVGKRYLPENLIKRRPEFVFGSLESLIGMLLIFIF